MRQPRCPLMQVRDDERAVGIHAIAGEQLHVQTTWMVITAPVAPAVMAGNHFSRCRSVQGPRRHGRIDGQLRIVAGHCRDDTATDHNAFMSKAPGVRYRERLLPGPMWWLIVAALVGMVAIAYGAALGTGIGVSTAVVLGAISAVGLWFGSPMITVDEEGVQCARARLPRSAIGDTFALAGDELRAARRGHHPRLPAASYPVLPVWAPQSALAIAVTDPADPHPAWLVGTRHPREFDAAITDLRDASAGAG